MKTDGFETVGNAKLEGLTKDLHITGNMYLFTLTIYFIGKAFGSYNKEDHKTEISD